MEQSLIHALFHVIDLGGEKAREKADILGPIILSNRLQVLNNEQDIEYVNTLIASLQDMIQDDLKREKIANKDTHEELIHAYVSLSKAVEYAKMSVRLKR
ncbi:hypothetical protein CN918_26220 [Priestia megaterium]|nr:hypothetical protein CN918_26220 [Priestia megaterium]